jgi:hypothetical protein
MVESARGDGCFARRGLELLQRLEANPPVPWKLLAETFEQLNTAQDQEAVNRLYDELGKLIATGRDASLTQARTWRELREIFQERGRLVALESKRLHALRTTFTAAQGVSFIVTVLETAKAILKDRAVFRQLVDRLSALMPPEEQHDIVIDYTEPK